MGVSLEDVVMTIRDYNCSMNLGNIKNDNNFSIFIDSSCRKDGETNAFHFKFM